MDNTKYFFLLRSKLVLNILFLSHLSCHFSSILLGLYIQIFFNLTLYKFFELLYLRITFFFVLKCLLNTKVLGKKNMVFLVPIFIPAFFNVYATSSEQF